MDPTLKKVLNRNLPALVNQVDPQQLLIYLECLTPYSKEVIDTAQQSKSRSYAAQKMFEHLIRRKDGFQQLVHALRKPEVGCTALADLLDSPDTQTDGRQPSLSTYEHPAQHASVINRRPQQCTSVTVVTHTKTKSPAKSPPVCDVNTPWNKLPASVRTTLKMFDAQNSMMKPDDLAGLLEFTNEDVAKVQSEINSGDSLTLTFIEISHQSKPVTLGNIMYMFHKLDRMDILRELEKLTAVRFEVRTDADNVSSTSALRPLQAIAGDLDQFSDGSKKDNYRINKHVEKHNASGVNALADREMRVDVKHGKERVEVSPSSEYSGYSQESMERRFKINRNGGIHGNIAQTDEIGLAQTNGNIPEYNNLDRSISPRSSYTENSMYDNLPDTSSLKDIDIDQEQKMISVKSNDFGERDNILVGMGEEIDKDNRGTLFTVEMVEQNEKNEIVQYSAVQETKAPGIVETDLHQTCGFPKISTASGDSSFLQADFERRKLEGKLLDVKMNISEIFSQSDQQELEDFSLSQSIVLRNSLSTGETKANTATHSIVYSADQDLEDEIEKRTDIPKLSIGSSDVNSIKRKAAKVFSYYGQNCVNHDVLVDIDNLEYSDESFEIDFDLNDQAPSPDGDMLLDERSEQKLQAVQPCDQHDGQSNEFLHYSVQQPPNIVRFNHEEERQSNEIASSTNEDKESEITASGPMIMSNNESSEIKMTLCDSKTELKGMHVEHSDNEKGMHEKQQACSKVGMNNVDNVTVSKPSLENSSVEVIEDGNAQDVESDDSERMDCDNRGSTNRAFTECAIIKRVSTGTDRAANTNTNISTDKVSTDASIDRDSTNRRQGVESLSTVLNVVKTVYDSIM